MPVPGDPWCKLNPPAGESCQRLSHCTLASRCNHSNSHSFIYLFIKSTRSGTKLHWHYRSSTLTYIFAEYCYDDPSTLIHYMWILVFFFFVSRDLKRIIVILRICSFFGICILYIYIYTCSYNVTLLRSMHHERCREVYSAVAVVQSSDQHQKSQLLHNMQHIYILRRATSLFALLFPHEINLYICIFK